MAQAIVTPALAGGAIAMATPAFAQPDDTVCYVIDVVCSRQDPTNCWVCEPQLDPDCDGNPG